MWYVLIAEIAFASLFVILQTPKKWWQNKITFFIVSLFHGIGISSIVILLWFFYRINNSFIKELIIKIETFYLSFVIVGFVFAMFRAFLFYATRHNKNSKFKKIIFSPISLMITVTVSTIVFVLLGTKNANEIKKTTYMIESTKLNEPFKIALISDLHLGAGADKNNLDDMTRIVNDMNADCLLIAGDITDSGSSEADIEYFNDSLKKIKTKYGIIAIEGNHEEQCHYGLANYLDDVVLLNDEAVILNDKVVLIGLNYKNNGLLTDIKREYDISNNQFIVSLKHSPSQLRNMANDCDLVLCGHTHGYQYPFTAVTTAFVSDMRYGLKHFDKMVAITSSGLSQWGIHAKWPSHSEVVEIVIN